MASIWRLTLWNVWTERTYADQNHTQQANGVSTTIYIVGFLRPTHQTITHPWPPPDSGPLQTCPRFSRSTWWRPHSLGKQPGTDAREPDGSWQQIWWIHQLSVYSSRRSRVTHICVSKLDHHWFIQWPVDCTAPSHYLNQCWFIVNKTLGNKLQWNSNRNTKLVV